MRLRRLRSAPRKKTGRHSDEFTTFLYAKPSFLSGMALALDIGGTLNEYNQSLTPAQADAIALRMDARAVAHDMHEGIRVIGTSVPRSRSARRRAVTPRRRPHRS